MSEWELEDGQDDAGTYFFSSCHRFPPGASTRLVAAPALYNLGIGTRHGSGTRFGGGAFD